ncbi:MAG: glutamate 5-kinase [Candidatus Pacebacteria bacterium]|nr:glutamate 5-kinase [Candidatus Paceibacterota bacterium]
MSDRIVVKIGSRVLTKKDGALNKDVIAMRVKEYFHAIKEQAAELVVVSSGAVSAGRSLLDLKGAALDYGTIKYSKDILREQILAAVGQPDVISSWKKEFEKYGILCGQILTPRKVFADRADYLSIRTVTTNLMKFGVVPIFNRNDTMSPEDIDFTDNDQLACLVAAMIQADKLIILTDVDGVYTGSPGDPKSKLVDCIEDAMKYISYVDKNSGTGKGGMKTKLSTADLATSLGIDVYIANGLTSSVITDILSGEKRGTFFPAKHKGKVKPIKYWLATAATSEGKIIVSTYLADLLAGMKAASVLFSGIEQIVGDFQIKDVVEVCDDSGKLLGRGLIRFSSNNLRKKLEEYKTLPKEERDRSVENSMTAIHYNDFARC